jgi:hypothetical protein
MGSENSHACAQNAENGFGFDSLERYHKDGDEFLDHVYEKQVMEPRFHLWKLKPKSSKSSGCTHIRPTSRKSLNKRLPESWWQLFSGTGKMEFIQGNTIISQVYWKTQKLCRVTQNTGRGMLTSGVVLRHDIVRPHTSTAARAWSLLEHFNWELFDIPPYSPDLAPSDYYLFTHLSNWSGSQRFNNNEELMEGFKMWLSSQAADFSDTNIKNSFPDTTNVSFPAVTTLKSSLNMWALSYILIFSHRFVNSHRKLLSE